MRRTAILYGLALAALVLVLKLLQYKYLVRDLSIEFYMGALAVVFTAVGAWAGLKLTKKKTIVVKQPVPLQPFAFDPTRLEKLGISNANTRCSREWPQDSRIKKSPTTCSCPSTR